MHRGHLEDLDLVTHLCATHLKIQHENEVSECGDNGVRRTMVSPHGGWTLGGWGDATCLRRGKTVWD